MGVAQTVLQGAEISYILSVKKGPRSFSSICWLVAPATPPHPHPLPEHSREMRRVGVDGEGWKVGECQTTQTNRVNPLSSGSSHPRWFTGRCVFLQICAAGGRNNRGLKRHQVPRLQRKVFSQERKSGAPLFLSLDRIAG